eukprot:1080911-Pleurochrysis_carterae.AAC.1
MCSSRAILKLQILCHVVLVRHVVGVDRRRRLPFDVSRRRAHGVLRLEMGLEACCKVGRAEAKVLQAHLVRQVHLEEALLRAALPVCTSSRLSADRHELVKPSRLQHVYLGVVAACSFDPSTRDQLLLPWLQALPHLVDVRYVHEVALRLRRARGA